MHCNIKVNINSKYTYINAIIDTGNFLREPITKTPVIVVEKEILYGIIPNKILNNLNQIIGGDVGQEFYEEENIEYMSKFRVIPFTSLGKENGMILGFKAEKVIIEIYKGLDSIRSREIWLHIKIEFMKIV